MLTEELGKDAGGLGISQIVPLPASIRSKVAKEYMEALKNLGRGTPSFYGLEAFIEAKVWLLVCAGLQRMWAIPMPSLGRWKGGANTTRADSW